LRYLLKKSLRSGFFVVLKIVFLYNNPIENKQRKMIMKRKLIGFSILSALFLFIFCGMVANSDFVTAFKTMFGFVVFFFAMDFFTKKIINLAVKEIIGETKIN
tara:strand:+ start:22123 stop:22431 length:309 start_codon:yes stop_codon:yes gene_type:complete